MISAKSILKRMQAFKQVSFIKIAGLFAVLASTGCSSLFYYPSSHLYYPPEKNNLAHEEYEMKTPDGETLYAWFFPAKMNSKKKVLGTIVQFHGNAENMTSHYASLVWATREGYNLFTFDYRGYGKSTGTPNQKGTNIDSNTALGKAYDLHKKTCPDKSCKFIVFGQSLGGAISMRALEDFSHRDEVSLIVMDSTFTSYKDVAQGKLASFFITWLFSPLGQVLVSDAYESTESNEKNRTPLLVIHDVHDPVMSFDHGLELYKASQAKKDFWMIDQSSHVGVFTLENKLWRDRFIRYLEVFDK